MKQGPSSEPQNKTAEIGGFPFTTEIFYRTALENLAVGVIITDSEDRIQHVNKLAAQITGYAPEEMFGKEARMLLGPRGNISISLAPVKDTPPDQLASFDAEVRRKDGNSHWIHVELTPYLNNEGQAIGRIAAITSIDLQKRLEMENELLQDEIRLNFGNIIGQSQILQKVLSQIATVAPTDANALLLGESGTGKELVARAIHESSLRKQRALVCVNCASIPRELFESEFFGHARGAFTGAIKDRVGRFELADDGTLFLDEIGEIPLELQSKLLRVLQDGQFERVGEDRTRTVNVRIIAATNRNLLAEAKAGRFRLDLYYRLSVFPIEMPPLRERLEDIPPLAEHFIRQSARRFGVSCPRLTKFQAHELQLYDWPGNVRELQNVIERAVLISRGGKLQFDLPVQTSRLPQAPLKLQEINEEEDLSLDALVVREREIVLSALHRRGWKIYGFDGAAALLNVKPTTLVSMMKRLKIEKPLR